MGTEENNTLENKVFSLPNKQVRVSYIHRKKGMAATVPDNHVIAGGMLNTATREYCLPLLRNGMLKNPLTPQEKAFLESEKGINRDLSIYSARDFWAKRTVTLRKGENILDLSNPIDYIDYKILLANQDLIAPSLKEKNNKLTYQFVVTDEAEERELHKDRFNYKKKAFKLYSTVESNPDVLRGIIKVLTGRPVSKESDLGWIQEEAEKLVDTKSKEFVLLLESSTYEYSILLSQAVDEGLVTVINKRYSTVDGIDLSEPGEVASHDNAVSYLADPKNSELVDYLRAKLKK